MTSPTVAVVSFRLGGPDGVSVAAARWSAALTALGFRVRTVAGEGPVDRCLPGLAIDAPQAPSAAAVAAALVDADLVLVENLCTIPLNPAAAQVVASVLRGRPAILHHHDPPWQRARFAHVTDLPPEDRAWRHVTVNRLTEAQFAARGLAATTVYNGFALDGPPGRREATRAALGVAADERLVLHPVRAIERKAVPVAIALAEAVGATYWLTGPAEEGYGPTLARLLRAARVPVLRLPVGTGAMADAYAACDAVVFPSTWEGFGNPPIEAGIHHRPVAVGRYPVADELRALGFHWLSSDDPAPLSQALSAPDHDALARNRALVERWFSQAALEAAVATLLDEAGWRP